MSKAKQAVREASKLSEEALAEQAASSPHACNARSKVQGNTITFQHGDAELTGILYKASSIDGALQTEVMDLLEENMREMYTLSSMGWNRREKQGELFDKAARFLSIRDKIGGLAAFVNWRFDCEECDEDDPQARPEEDVVEVLYCYEVQIKSTYRSKRLGRLLMDMLLAIAKQSRMKKIMLTVFLANQPARNFYTRLDYSSDLISPIVVEKGTSTADYDIMSLAVV